MRSPQECPKGHLIGTEGRRGFCTGSKCGSHAEEPPEETEAQEDALATQEADRALAGDEEENSLLARMRRVGLTRQLEGKDAEDWADQFIISELPGALAELAYQRRYSPNPRDRRDAALQFINSAGRGKKDAVVAGASPIIIMTGGAELVGPWKKASTVVEGAVVPAKEPHEKE